MRFLKFVKQLEPKDAENLRIARKNIEKFNELPDASFLSDDFFSSLSTNLLGINDTIKYDLGFHKLPNFDLNLNYELFFSHTNPYNKEGTYYFQIYRGKNDGKESIFIDIINSKNYACIFFPSLVYNSNFPVMEFGRAFILNTALFFQNKMIIYRRIHSYLLSGKNNLVKLLGEECTKDIISLFSGVNKKDNSQKIVIPANNVSESFYNRINVSKRMISLGSTHYFIGKEAGPESTHCSVRLWLDDKDRLIIVAEQNIHNSLTGNDEPMDVDIKELGLKVFFTRDINTWLNQILATSELCLSIFEKVKTKIFVENI